MCSRTDVSNMLFCNEIFKLVNSLKNYTLATFLIQKINRIEWLDLLTVDSDQTFVLL